MRVQVKEFYYWKTEHKNESGCQDAYEYDPARGLFIIADGAGTTLYPALWARILARHFLQLPLLSVYPFEVEWWLRQAQDQYKRQIPSTQRMQEWNTRHKALQEGSASTLAALRITESSEMLARGELWICGDSCILVGRTSEQSVVSYMLTRPEEFERGPICLPSDLRFFQRGFHVGQRAEIELLSGDVVILATDAVSKWILSKGHETCQSPWEAFETILQRQPGEDWQRFINHLRTTGQIVDDDSTALVLQFQENSDDTNDGQSSELGRTIDHSEALREERRRDFERARQEDNKELMAIYYGDGIDLEQASIVLTADELAQIQRVADAQRTLLRTMQETKNTPFFKVKVEAAWRQHQDLLLHEPGAANIRESLRNQGIILESPAAPSAVAPISDSSPSQQPQSTSSTPPLETAQITPTEVQPSVSIEEYNKLKTQLEEITAERNIADTC